MLKGRKIMDRIILYTAYTANILLLIAVFIMAGEAYGKDVYLIMLIGVPPLISLFALRRGPDAVERRLEKTVRKTRLKNELKEMGVSVDEKGRTQEP